MPGAKLGKRLSKGGAGPIFWGYAGKSLLLERLSRRA
jgi:hypothetical protein